MKKQLGTVHTRSYTRQPLVSVVMPVHNGADYLRESIDSILAQMYTNLEIIITNDSSTDDTALILAEYTNRFPDQIRVITTTAPLGKSGDPATNLAIAQAQGEFIAKMDADDIAKPERIATQVQYLLDNPEIYLIGTQAEVIDKTGAVIGKKDVPLSHTEIYKNFFLYNYIIHPSVMFRNKLHGKKFYDIRFPYFNEYYTFFKFMTEGKKMANVPESLMYYRVHGANDTFNRVKTKFMSTLHMRLTFVSELGYKPTFQQMFITVLQALFVFSMPEKLITLAYLVSRKVVKISDLIKAPVLYARLFSVRTAEAARRLAYMTAALILTILIKNK